MNLVVGGSVYLLFWNTKKKRNYLITRFLLEICKIDEISYLYKKDGFEIFYKDEKILDINNGTGLREIVVKKNKNFNNLSEPLKDKIGFELSKLDFCKIENLRLNIK